MKQIKRVSGNVTWFLIAAVMCGGLARLASATTYYWDNTSPIETTGFGTAGGTWGTDAKWSTSNTGVVTPGTTATTTNDTLNFGTATASYGLATGTITINGTVEAKSITVGSQSGAITLSGGNITNMNGTSGASFIQNNSTNTLTIGSNVDFGTNGSFRSLVCGSGGIIINGNIRGSGSGARMNTTGAVTINGNITGEGLQINSGMVTVGNSGLTWVGITSNDSGTQGGTLNLNGNSLSVSGIAGGITITDNAVGNGTSLLTLATGTSSQNAATTGIISDGSNGRQVAITYNGATSLSLSQTNTYSGNTKSAGSGKITLANNLAIQNSAIDTSGAGKLALYTNGVTTLTIGGLIGSKNMVSVFDATYTNLTALTLNPGAGQTNTYSGSITNGASGMTLTKTGAGVQILTGTNLYTGSTSVNAGVLVIGATYALPSGTNVNINATGKLQLDANASAGWLYLDGKATLKGIWGSPVSGAPHTSGYFLGNGKLTVINGLPSGTFIRFF